MSKAKKPYNGKVPSVYSDTSRAAAASLDGKPAQTLRDKVHACIVEAGDWGATDHEIEEALSMKHQTASARRRELVLLGQVVDTGRRRETPSGRTATVWRAVRKGEQVTLEETIAQVDVIRDKTRARLRHCKIDQLDRVWELLNEMDIAKR